MSTDHSDDYSHDQEHSDDHDHHSHDHSKPHAHQGHSHAPNDFGRAFLIGTLLNTGFVAAEAIYGVLSNSLALIADAGHNLSDVLGLLLAWGASALVKRAPSKRFTYGLRSTSILAALINAVLLLVVTGGIAWEAILRFNNPSKVEGMTVVAVAALGVVINLVTALLFMSGRKGDLNIRAAFSHMMADAAIALGVVVAGVLILNTGWHWIDPIASIVISVLIIGGTWGLLKDSINLALHAVPPGIRTADVENYLLSIDGVSEVHDLHIWGMSTTETALTVHLVCKTHYLSDEQLSDIRSQLGKVFSIAHATIQVERGDAAHPCELAGADVV